MGTKTWGLLTLGLAVLLMAVVAVMGLSTWQEKNDREVAIEALRYSIANLTDQNVALRNQIAVLETRTGGAEASAGKLSGMIASLDRKVSSIESGVASSSRRVSFLEENGDILLKLNVSDLQHQVYGKEYGSRVLLTSRIDTLETDVSSLKRTVSGTSLFGSLGSDMSSLKSRIDSIEYSLKGRINNLETDTSSLKSSISAIESSIRSLKYNLSLEGIYIY